MARPFEALLPRIQELRDLSGVIQHLSWDRETFLPPAGLSTRGAQLSTLQGLYHERLVDPRVGEWLQAASADTTLTEDQRAMVRELSRERSRATRIPERLVRALAHAQAAGLTAWRQARQDRRFATFAPALERLLALRQEEADACDVSDRYDALLDHYEPEMTVARLEPLLARLRQRLVPAVRAMAALRSAPQQPWESQTYPAAGQLEFSLVLLRAMGFHLDAGRMDQSIHPFTSATDVSDVRLTTRFDEKNPCSGLFSTLHEGGHGLYEQGFDPSLVRTVLARGASMGLHESQSRLWENQVGRSRSFWEHFLPQLTKVFPSALQDVTVDDFYRAINRVRPSLIRTEADEVTYNLHIILRFELELALLRGELLVKDLPVAWNEGMEKLLGVRPGDDVEGVLQDIHWSTAEFGYFPTYTLGNLYAASLFAAARRARPALLDELARGELLPLLGFLREHVHRHGLRLTAEQRVTAATGRGLTEEDFFDYLRDKFGPLYPGSFA